MTRLNDIIPIELLEQEMAEGFIRMQVHPDHDHYGIFNYTEKAQFERRWNEATRVCRGLIVNRETEEVLARPFPKIHNFDEQEAPRIVDNQRMYYWGNKYDGSLGILYRLPDGTPALATRGSFASEQAIKGTQMLHASGEARLWDEWIDEGYTPLFEICYPENRIVLKYEEEFLAKLGFIHMDTGRYMPPLNVGHEPRTMHDLLMDLSRPNAEGWVAWLTDSKAVKIKQADYVALHRLVSNLTPKEVWRQLRDGTFAQYAMALPDEFRDEVLDMGRDLEKRAQAIEDEALSWYTRLAGETSFTQTRKDMALWIQREVPGDYRGMVFALLDDKSISDKAWKMVEPGGD